MNSLKMNIIQAILFPTLEMVEFTRFKIYFINNEDMRL